MAAPCVRLIAHLDSLHTLARCSTTPGPKQYPPLQPRQGQAALARGRSLLPRSMAQAPADPAQDAEMQNAGVEPGTHPTSSGRSKPKPARSGKECHGRPLAAPDGRPSGRGTASQVMHNIPTSIHLCEVFQCVVTTVPAVARGGVVLPQRYTPPRAPQRQILNQTT